MKIVFVVDDNKMNLMMAERVLRGAYTVEKADSGSRALELLEEKRPDLILLDIMMPEMDGFETLEKIRQRQEWCDIPVIFLTADTDEDTVQRALDAGAESVVEKPFKKDSLLDKVAEALG